MMKRLNPYEIAKHVCKKIEQQYNITCDESIVANAVHDAVAEYFNKSKDK